MKAAVVKKPGVILVEEVTKPKCDEHSVLVRVHSVSICNNGDVEWWQGRWEPMGGQYPFILGHEFSGEIVEVGDKVTQDLRPGDRIAEWSWGQGMAEYVALDTRIIALAKIPDKISYEEGSLLEIAGGGTMQMVWSVGMKPSDRVLVLGCGPAGLCLVQHARNFGAEVVVATDLFSGRLDMAKKLGADACYVASDYEPEELAQQIKAEFGEMDVVFDAAGVNPALRTGLATIRRGGVYGVFAHPSELSVPLRMFSCTGVWMVGMLPWDNLEQLQRLLKLGVRYVAEGRLNLKDLITHRLPLEEVEQGLRLCEENPETTIKVVLEI